MYRKFLLLTLLAWSSYGVWANVSTNFDPISTPVDACDLAAPTNFQVLELGATWVRLIWTPSVLGVDHSVKTFRVSDGMLVHQAVVPAAMASSIIVNGLQPGETYFSTICAICPDGIESIYVANTPNFDTIITELIVAGFTESCGSSYCGIRNPGEFCKFSLDGSSTYFKIQPQSGIGASRQFLLQKVTTPDGQRLRCRVNLNNAPYSFWVDGQPGNQQGVQGEKFEIKIPGATVATFKLSENYLTTPAQGHLTWTMENTGYEILKLYYLPCGSGGALLDPSNGDSYPHVETQTSASRTAVVSPNPFWDNLEIYLTQIAANPVQLQLYNLSGQKVLDQQFPGGQDQYSLATQNLATGFYLLRIEADGQVQTLKVIKSE